MKLLAHVHGYPPVHNAGAEWALHEMLMRLQTLYGYECSVYASARASAGNFHGITVHMNLPEPQIRALYMAHDLILTHLDNTSIAARMAASTKKPLIHYVHNDAQLARHKIVAETNNFALFNSEWLREKVGWPGECAVVYPPIDHARYASKSGTHEKVTLVNLTIPKGASVFYEVAARMPQTKFLGVRGAYGNQLDPPKSMRNVQVVSSTLDMARIYGKTRVILMPSSYESWGRVAMEACGQGIPVIANPTSGLVESLGWAGIFVSTRDIDGWVKALGALEKKYDEQAERVRQRSEEVDEMISEQLDILHQRLSAFVRGERTTMLVESVPAPAPAPAPVVVAPRPARIVRTIDDIAASRSPRVVDFYASEPQYADHLVNVLLALPESMRGSVLLNDKGRQAVIANDVRQRYVIEGVRVERAFAAQRGPIVVSSYGDLREARNTGRPIVLMEHGAGQSYSGRQNSYAGGQDRSGVALLLTPNRMAAERNHRAHPGIPNAVIGCPKLDQWHLQPPRERSSPPRVCVSFHWDATFITEARSGFQHFRSALPILQRAKEYELVCHAHPRIRERMERTCAEFGIRFIPNFADVVRECDLFAIDNSSTLFEFASLDRPVVVMNPPWYRKGANHGLRFWDCADVGVQCDHPDKLHGAILLALSDDVEQQQRRHAIIDRVYAVHDGTASAKAAEAIIRCDACWNNTATRSVRKGDSPMSVQMVANVSFWRRGHKLAAGEKFWCDDAEAMVLERTRVPGRGGTRASRFVEAPPAPAPGPTAHAAIEAVPEVKADDVSFYTTRPLGDEPAVSTEDVEQETPVGVVFNFECTVCGKIFDTASALRGHSMSHKREKRDEV